MRAAIIGCGFIGKKRAAALPVSVKLVGCFDAILASAEKFAEEFNTRTFSSIEDLLATQEIDFVVVATRHDSLSSIALAVLDAGKNVFIEKPGALNYQELVNVRDVANKKNLRVHVGYNHRHHLAVRKAYEIFNDGSIGAIMFLRGRYGHGGRLGYEKEWRADKLISGGGELIDQGTHLIDLSIGYLGEVQLDYAATPTYFWNMPVEDNAFIALRNNAGNIAFLQVSCTEWKNMFSFEVYGQTGKLDISGLGRSYGLATLTLHKMRPEMGPPISETWTFPEPDVSWGAEMEEFIGDLLTGSKESDNLESSLEVLRVINEIYSRTSK